MRLKCWSCPIFFEAGNIKILTSVSDIQLSGISRSGARVRSLLASAKRKFRISLTPYPSLNHLVRPRQHAGGNRQADSLRGLEIDDELKLRRLFYRKVGRLSAFQNLVHIRSGVAVQVVLAHAVGHEAPVFHKFSPVV